MLRRAVWAKYPGHAINEPSFLRPDALDVDDRRLRATLAPASLEEWSPTARPQAAELLGVSADTVRRWAESGRLTSWVGEDGKRYFKGEELARPPSRWPRAPPSSPRAQSARNRFVGIVTRVVMDTVVAQVEIQAGPHRFVSLITREAADELELAPGVVVDTVIKATNVSVEIPGRY